MTTTAAQRTGRRNAFALGVALSLFPALGPVSAALLLAARPLRPERRDGLWLLAALAFAVAGVAADGLVAGALGVGAVAGPWVVYRSFAELRALDPRADPSLRLAWGLLVGFVVTLAIGLVRAVLDVDVTTSLSGLDAIVWRSSPAQFAHAALVLGGLIALLTRRHRNVSWSSMALAGGAIMVTGSLDAAIGWIGLAAALVAMPSRRHDQARWPDLAIAAGLVTVLGIVPTIAGWGVPGFSLDGSTSSTNLFAATESIRNDAWDDRWVDVRAHTVTIDGATMRAFDVDRRGSEPWMRLQQLVRVDPGATYTLSAWIDASTLGAPGLHGWGSPGGGEAFVLTASLRDDAWTGSVTGPGRLVETGIVSTYGDWRRVRATFTVADDVAPFTFFVGFAPDTVRGAGAPGRVAGLMLARGAAIGPYVPGPARSGLDFGYARAPIWRAAWEGVRQRPLFGWGGNAFSDFYAGWAPGIERQEFVPAHPHSLFLWILFERGVVGLVGLGLLLASLFGLAVRYRDVGLLAVVGAILVANLFDTTLLSSAVLYPLAAVAGWRSTRRGARRTTEPDAIRQAGVRASLAASDLSVAFLSLLVAQRLAASIGAPFDASAASLYALFAWPALAWREGLYPGYGLTPAQELKKQVTAVVSATVLVGVGARLFPEALTVPIASVALLGALTVFASPLVRAGAKRLLHGARIWGRPVVVLGAGATGTRVVRGLTRTPLDGLHPVAFFDDDPGLRTKRVLGVRVRGGLDEAQRFARRHHVHHAIVAIPHLDQGRLDRLITGSSHAFRRVQFVPNLGALPAEDVDATALDGMLALEVRNGLYSPLNRVAKRTADIVTASLASAALAPVLASLWLWVRLDSPGGGFHRSERIGQDGRAFHCLKFRTMFEDAETRLGEILATDPERRAEYERWHKLDDDPRVTRAGRFLRRTSLDELPQLWNVLRGQMSLVGPRPYLAREIPDMGAYAGIIFQAKPGVTGHWQVSGRSSVTFAERLEMEAHYVRNWSVWWDVILVVQTPLAVLSNHGDAK